MGGYVVVKKGAAQQQCSYHSCTHERCKIFCVLPLVQAAALKKIKIDSPSCLALFIAQNAQCPYQVKSRPVTILVVSESSLRSNVGKQATDAAG
eukprot:6196039-Pleurochrysis_carterae.AAC.2